MSEIKQVEQNQQAPSGSQESPKTFESIDAFTLLGQEYSPLQFSVNEILPHGLFILAGSSKIGKSWLVLDVCRAVSMADKVWDFTAQQGEVLYLALEDNNRRLQSRLKKIGLDVLGGDGGANDGLTGLHLVTASFGINSGLIEQIHNFISVHPNVKLLVIDTLECVRDTTQDKGIYACDYRDMTALREITDKYELTLLLIHHTRKMNDDDPLNMLSGSTGLTGSVDGILVLQKEKRISNKAIITIANRDTDEHCFNLEFDRQNCKWIFKGECIGEANVPKPSLEEVQADKREWLCLLVDDFVDKSWSGTATELAKELNEIDGSGDLEITHLNVKRKLMENADVLAKGGIIITEGKSNSTRRITLTRR